MGPGPRKPAAGLGRAPVGKCGLGPAGRPGSRGAAVAGAALKLTVGSIRLRLAPRCRPRGTAHSHRTRTTGRFLFQWPRRPPRVPLWAHDSMRVANRDFLAPSRLLPDALPGRDRAPRTRRGPCGGAAPGQEGPGRRPVASRPQTWSRVFSAGNVNITFLRFEHWHTHPFHGQAGLSGTRPRGGLWQGP